MMPVRVIFTIIGSLMIVDCTILMAVGKVNFGSVVPFLVGMVFVAHGIFWRNIIRFICQNRWLGRLWYGLWMVFFIWLISFGIFVYALQQQIKQSAKSIPEVAAIIVLGSGTVAGKPTPTLAKRLDTAAPLIDSQKSALVITSGGIGFGQTRSEAYIMATYLYDTYDIPLKHILQEGQSTSTAENLIYSQEILAAKGISIKAPIAIVTSDFHIIRAANIARHQGYVQPIMLASPTPLSIRYNAWFREYFAFVSGWLFGEY
ncbi:YdcF family protein [Psychrobacter sp. ANT_H56B]|uniref:YdcF family protein n=1 Tax=Psychrobacter sp. ANT_H56B TaxID=2597353 RepID=UPI0011F2327C|nr:YdcF family protein [Psychrobacter sp. ANT_H56B]KAA0923737.1 YdcF family protein [Psychrobacter sp. ANT_H56B]